jgi:putative membrane protein
MERPDTQQLNLHPLPWHNPWVLLLVSSHLMGVVGFLVPQIDQLLGQVGLSFAALTPFHLLLVGYILSRFHHPKSKKFWGTAGAVAILGYAVEVLGVNTGFPFGNYTYGSALGFKLFATPLLIGLNWLVLVYTFSSIASVMLYDSSRWLQAAASATALTLFDVLVEPVAIALDFWWWEGTTIPAENFLAWWALSFIFSVMMVQLNKVNPVVWWVGFCQLFFFSCLRIVLIFLE